MRYSWTAFRPLSARCAFRPGAKRASQTRRSIASLSDDLALSTSQLKTIYALSTPPGKAGIGVVRVSGPDVLSVWTRMVRASASSRSTARDFLPQSHKMYRCRVVLPDSDEILDDGLAVYFKGPRSFTSEDVLELHVHSGRAVVTSLLASLSRLPGCRPAEPGEFTRRAFDSGRLDLTQVEGLKDLIDAETDTQRRVALKAAQGASKTRFEELRSKIIQCLALVEALIDFGEGEEIEEGAFDMAREMAMLLRATIEQYLANSRHGEIVRSGIRLAIFGPPNAGKSSLLNFLVQREAAIVTPVPGTTRDILELSLDIGGLPVIVADTAGLRMTDDIVERIGVERATSAVQAANVSLCVLSLPEVLFKTSRGSEIRIPPSVKPLITPTTFFLLNKFDLAEKGLTGSELVDYHDHTAWTISLKTNEGTADFLAGFASALRERYDVSASGTLSGPAPFITHARQRVHLEQASNFLAEFLATQVDDIVLGAESLRYAANAIGQVTGVIGAEDILDSLFKNFCIGK